MGGISIRTLFMMVLCRCRQNLLLSTETTTAASQRLFEVGMVLAHRVSIACRKPTSIVQAQTNTTTSENRGGPKCVHRHCSDSRTNNDIALIRLLLAPACAACFLSFPVHHSNIFFVSCCRLACLGLARCSCRQWVRTAKFPALMPWMQGPSECHADRK